MKVVKKLFSESPQATAESLAKGYCEPGEKTKTIPLETNRPNGYVIEGPTDYDVVYFL